MMPLLPTLPTAKRPPARLEGRESASFWVRRDWGIEGARLRVWLISFWRRWKESCLLWCLRASDWSLCFAPMGLCAAGMVGDDEWTGQRELSWADTTMVMVIHDAEGMVLMLRWTREEDRTETFGGRR